MCAYYMAGRLRPLAAVHCQKSSEVTRALSFRHMQLTLAFVVQQQQRQLWRKLSLGFAVAGAASLVPPAQCAGAAADTATLPVRSMPYQAIAEWPPVHACTSGDEGPQAVQSERLIGSVF